MYLQSITIISISKAGYALNLGEAKVKLCSELTKFQEFMNGCTRLRPKSPRSDGAVELWSEGEQRQPRLIVPCLTPYSATFQTPIISTPHHFDSCEVNEHGDINCQPTPQSDRLQTLVREKGEGLCDSLCSISTHWSTLRYETPSTLPNSKVSGTWDKCTRSSQVHALPKGPAELRIKIWRLRIWNEILGLEYEGADHHTCADQTPPEIWHAFWRLAGGSRVEYLKSSISFVLVFNLAQLPSISWKISNNLLRSGTRPFLPPGVEEPSGAKKLIRLIELFMNIQNRE